jgi:hypothetical protein
MPLNDFKAINTLLVLGPIVGNLLPAMQILYMMPTPLMNSMVLMPPLEGPI